MFAACCRGHVGLLVALWLFADSAGAEVIASAGHLAAREDGSRWRLLSAQEDLPPQAEVRTSPAGATSVDVAGARLVIGANSRFRIDQQQRQLELHGGAIFLSSHSEWEVTAGDAFFAVPPETKANVSVSGGRTRIDVIENAVPLWRGASDGVVHAAPVSLTVEGDALEVSTPANAADWAASTIAWTKIRESQGLGQIVVSDPQSGSETRMEIARCHVNVVLKPPVALVQLDQSFYNPQNVQREGTFVFNLPQGASISRFAMFVTPEDLIEGELIERRQASRIYESIVHKRRDPAILEQIGDNLFRMRVFPIFARDTKRILLDFTVPIVERSGRYRFDLPLMSDLKPIWDFRLSGTIHPPVDPTSIVSRLNPQLTFKADERGIVRFSSQQQHVHPPARLDLEYRAPPQAQPRLSRFVAEEGVFGEEEQFFVASIPNQSVAHTQPPPSDIMVVADTSGSSKNLSLIKQSVRTILSNLGPEDRFQLACADDSLRRLTSEWHAADSLDLARALADLDLQFPLGASQLANTLEEALQAFEEPTEGRRRQLIYIGDGEATGAGHLANWMRTLLVRPKMRAVTFSGVRIGESGNGSRRLKRGVRQTGGKLFLVSSSRNLEDLFAWTLAGCPTGQSVGHARIENQQGAEIFADPTNAEGESLYIYGRCKPRDNLTLVTTIGGEQQEFLFSAENSSVDDTAVFAGRLWAQKKLEQLVESSPDPSDVQRRKIVKLSQEWSLLSPYTAFLVLETEADYVRWKIDRRLRRRYWKPPEALAAIPLPPEVVEQQRGESGQARASVGRRQTRTISKARFQQTLKAANAALKKDEPGLALRRLLAVKSFARQYGPDEYHRLMKTTQQRLQRERLLGELGIRRRQHDRNATLPLPSTDLFASLLGAGGISPDFLKRHPLARGMVKRVRPPQPKMPLTDFIDFVRKETGWSLLIDEIALTDVGVRLDEVLDLRDIEQITVRNLLYHALKPVELTYAVTPHLVRITSSEVGEEILQTRLYPVVDLIRTDQPPRPEQLSSPYWDLEQGFERQAEAALDQIVSVDFNDADGFDLREFRGWLAEQMGDNVRLDTIAMTDVGVPEDEPVALKLNDVPVRVVVETVLEPLELVCNIDREVVEVTSMEVTEDILSARCYSAVGVIYQFPRELTKAMESRRNRRWGNRWGGGGGSGGGGGGFIGGGGFGGGLGGGGIGGGGAFGENGGSGDADSGITETDAGMSLIDSPQTDETPEEPADDESVEKSVDEVPAADEVPADETPAADVPEFSASDSLPSGDAADWGFETPSREPLGFASDEVINLLQNETEGPWEDIDGIGGNIIFYAPAMTLVARQTLKVHREIEAELQLLRGLPVAGQRVRPAHIPLITEDMAAGWDMDELTELLQEQTVGPWEEIDGIGGSITPHVPSMSLMIKQTQQVHEELDALLTQLRRAMIINRRRISQWERGIRNTDRSQFGPQVVLTSWPILTPPDKTGTDRELELLSVRQVAPEFAARWRSTSGDAANEYRVRWNGPRLELKTGHVHLRSDGQQGSIRYPGLARVELDDWGETIRRVTDSILPWLPHVSNRELAALYNVERAAETDENVTLRLLLVSDNRVVITATFGRETGRPVNWDVSVAGTPSYRLEFEQTNDAPVVRAFDANNRQTEQWELLRSEPSTEIPPVGEQAPTDLVIDRRDPEAAFLRIHDALMQYDYPRAVQLLDAAIGRQPKQPLLNFLLAWTCEHAGKTVPNGPQREQQAIAVVVASQAADLLPLLRPENFREVSNGQLLALLDQIPTQERSLATIDAMIELAMRLNRFRRALGDLQDALLLPEGSTRERRLLEVDLLVETGAVAQAREAAAALSRGASADLLAELGDLFGKHGDLTAADAFFAEAKKLAHGDKQSLAALDLRQASWHPPASRWKLLIQAAELRPGPDPSRSIPLRTVIREAQAAADAKILARLAASTTHRGIRMQLLIQQARLMPNTSEAGRLCRQLLESGRVPDDDQNWMLRKIIGANDAAFVIGFLEAHLRQGKTVTGPTLRVLATAYENTGRPELARRADSQRKQEESRDWRQRRNWQRSAGSGFF